MDGLLIIDKPEGMTSAEVVRIVKRKLGCKTGHLGTLDPFASGVLPVCVGDGTKIAQFLNAADKEYTGILRLGSETDTGDPTGTVVATAPVPAVTGEQLQQVAQRFCGEHQQVPPMYSAIKQQGTPLYKLARQGIAVAREARAVRIDALQLTQAGTAALAFSVSCSKGTYIRVLAQEIGQALGTVGHLESLRRTRFGQFRLSDASALAALERTAVPLVGLRAALSELREIRVEAESARRARQGFEPILGSLQPGDPAEAAKLIGPDGELAAVIAADQTGRWHFARVFAREARAAL